MSFRLDKGEPAKRGKNLFYHDQFLPCLKLTFYSQNGLSGYGVELKVPLISLWLLFLVKGSQYNCCLQLAWAMRCLNQITCPSPSRLLNNQKNQVAKIYHPNSTVNILGHFLPVFCFFRVFFPKCQLVFMAEVVV